MQHLYGTTTFEEETMAYKQLTKREPRYEVVQPRRFLKNHSKWMLLFKVEWALI